MSVLRVVRVQGVSMSPTLADGDFVLVTSRRLRRADRAGRIVVVDHPRLGLVVKRVIGTDAQARLLLGGDNDLSSTSEDIGPVEPETVLGTAWLRIAPSGLRLLRDRAPSRR